MADWLVTTSVGVGLFLVGSLFLYTHVRTWRRQQADITLDDFDRRHYRNQYRRRMQASGMIAAMGVLVPAGYLIVNWSKGPVLFVIYVFALLAMSFWIMLLGLGDFLSTKTHGRAALARVREKRRALEEQLAEMKRGRRSNGHSSP